MCRLFVCLVMFGVPSVRCRVLIERKCFADAEALLNSSEQLAVPRLLSVAVECMSALLCLRSERLAEAQAHLLAAKISHDAVNFFFAFLFSF